MGLPDTPTGWQDGVNIFILESCFLCFGLEIDAVDGGFDGGFDGTGFSGFLLFFGGDEEGEGDGISFDISSSFKVGCGEGIFLSLFRVVGALFGGANLETLPVGGVGALVGGAGALDVGFGDGDDDFIGLTGGGPLLCLLCALSA